MRLIDADKFKQQAALICVIDNYDTSKVRALLEVIDIQPTTYDVDKVVERLDKASDCYESNDQGREHIRMVDLTEAIEIVKAGGIDE